MRTFTLLLAAWALFLTALPAPVSAQDAAQPVVSIAVVDVQALLTDSKAAKNIQEQVKKIRDDFQKEFKNEEAALQKEEQAIIEKRDSMSQEDYAQKVQGFQKKVADAQKKLQERGIKLDKAVKQATRDLREQILEIVAGVAKENGNTLVVSRQNVVLVDPALDISVEVMKRLNKKVSKIKIKAK